MRSFRSIKVFTDRFPWLGPLIYVLSIEFTIAEVITALAWPQPYNWLSNTISDLGNAACTAGANHATCSPLHTLMNLSFVAIGITMAAGSLFIYQEFRENHGTLVGFSFMAVAGLGTILAGVFPENTVAQLHIIGASLPFTLGNASLVILGFALRGTPKSIRIYTFLSGAVGLVALVFFVAGRYGPLGMGGVERVVASPQAVWLPAFGLYMSQDRVAYVRRFRHMVGRHFAALRQ